MKICGECVCALFAPLHCCLAPLPLGDKRRQKHIEHDTKCFVPMQFARNAKGRANESKRINLNEFHKLQEQLNQSRIINDALKNS